jgi:hypothetical protein
VTPERYADGFARFLFAARTWLFVVTPLTVGSVLLGVVTARWVMLLGPAASLWFAWRGATISVQVTPTHLVVRNVLTTERFRWDGGVWRFGEKRIWFTMSDVLLNLPERFPTVQGRPGGREVVLKAMPYRRDEEGERRRAVVARWAAEHATAR